MTNATTSKGWDMSGTNAELITEARKFFGEYHWNFNLPGKQLADALEAAEAALSAEKRDAALAEKHWHRDKADLDLIAAQRDTALAVIASVREWFAGSPDTNSYEDLRIILARAIA